MTCHVIVCIESRKGQRKLDTKMQIRINKELYENFKTIASENAQVPSLLVRKWIEDYVNKNMEGSNMIKDLGFGVVEFEGKEYALEQQAYIDGVQGREPYYKATAVDKNGNQYEVAWDVVENWEQIDDEEEMCDWDNPVSADKI